MLGRAWAEPELIRLAYSYEQATKHRRFPNSVPPLPEKSSLGDVAASEIFLTLNRMALVNKGMI